jgi:flagellar hook-basal body complex protein FliE
MTRIDSGAGRDDLLRGALSRIASGGGDASALREMFEERTAQLRKSFEESAAQTNASSDPLSDAARNGLRTLDAELTSADSITTDVIAGRIDSAHEVAARIKRADLTMKFSMEIRNRLIDAYREVMRMSV